MCGWDRWTRVYCRYQIHRRPRVAHSAAQDFLEYLMDEAGEEMFRMKGVLAVTQP